MSELFCCNLRPFANAVALRTSHIDKSGGKYLLCGKWRHSVKCWQENRERVVPCWWPLGRHNTQKQIPTRHTSCISFGQSLFFSLMKRQIKHALQLNYAFSQRHSFHVSSTQSSLALRQLFCPWSKGRYSQFAIEPGKENSFIFCQKKVWPNAEICLQVFIRGLFWI